MPKAGFCMLLIGCALLGDVYGQQVIVGRDADTTAAATPKKSAAAQPAAATRPESSKPQAAKPSLVRSDPISAKPVEKPKGAPAVSIGTTATTTSPKAGLPAPSAMRLTKVEGPAPEPHPELPVTSRESGSQFFRMPLETAFVKVADGFDYAVGKPEAQGYYKARGFRSHGHMGEDWDGLRGGDTDLNDPVYCIGDGVVVFARDCHMGWGNVIIIRHSYREGGVIKNIDSLYGHVNKMLVHRGQVVSRGQQIATIGNAHGLYDAHLHLEIRKNIEIGMSRAKFAQDSSNYFDPTQFINTHRRLTGGGQSYRVAMNTFFMDSRINWSAVRNYSHSRHRGGTRESATALKKAVAKKN
jgi:murein DD-endopeptidase MepM/ murein hydrolase activator NlpD